MLCKKNKKVCKFYKTLFHLMQKTQENKIKNKKNNLPFLNLLQETTKCKHYKGNTTFYYFFFDDMKKNNRREKK